MSHFRIILLACAVWLTGARDAYAQAASGIAISNETSSGKGTVILSVTHDEDTGNRAWTSFYVDSTVPEALLHRHILSSIDMILGIPRRSDLKDLYGRVYVLELAAGSHKVDGWHTSFPWGHLAPASAPPALHFEVGDGEIVYLGNLNMVNRLARPSFILPWVPVGGTPEVRDRQQVDLPIAEAKAPELKGKVQVRLLPLGTWGPRDPQTQTHRSPPPIVITK